MAIIEVDHVTKEFRLGQLHSMRDSFRNAIAKLTGAPVPQRQRFKALDDVSFSVQPGEVLGIIGHNGAGKSTLLKILAGITRPTTGRVLVRGRVAPLIEVGAGLVPDLTGRENVLLNATILGMKRAEIRRKFDDIIAFAELEQFVDTPIKRYSSGMQVRLGFAIATAVDADILIVDEVLAVGDLAFQRKCFDRMEELIRRHGRTVLLVSHNIRQVSRMCERVMLLHQGRIMTDGATASACNAFYELSDKKIHRIAGPNTQRALSSGEIELTDIFLRDDMGKKVSEVNHLSDVTVCMTFNVLKPIRRPVFGVGVHTTDFLYLGTTHARPENCPELLQPGSHTVLCRINSLPFVPGIYCVRVGVALGESQSTALYVENALSLKIVAPAALNRFGAEATEGFVIMDTCWELPQPSASELVDQPARAHRGLASI